MKKFIFFISLLLITSICFAGNSESGGFNIGYTLGTIVVLAVVIYIVLTIFGKKK